jgi:hypothetical protein
MKAARGPLLIVVVGTVVPGLLAGCTSGRVAPAGGPPEDRAAQATSGPAPTAGCESRLTQGVLPEWARAGFSDATPRMPHVLGDRGDIVAIVFGHPLRQPPEEGRNNKILWVSRAPVVPADRLEIEGRLEGTGPPVRREVAGGPGPSIIDFPRPGCWRLTLRWSDHVDTIALDYLAP